MHTPSDIIPTRPAGDYTRTSPEELGYRAPTACHIAGITYRQCDYWARTELVEPTIRAAHGNGTQRLYSAADIVLLRVVKKLLDAGISLQNVRRTLAHLPVTIDALTERTIASDGDTVWTLRTASDVWEVLQSGDAMYAISVGNAVRDVLTAIADLPGESTLPPLQVVS